MNRGDQYRLRIADVPVVIRKARKPHRCVVCQTGTIAVGDLAGSISIRKREGRHFVHSSQHVCAACVEARCDAVESRIDRFVPWDERDTSGALPWE